jgi:hypothetical protein
MKNNLGSAALLFALCLCACSSSSSPPGSTSTGGDGGTGTVVDSGPTGCTATAAGGTTGTQPCGVGAAFINGNTSLQIETPDQTIGVSIIIEFTGPPTAKTYTAATVINSLGDFKSTDKTTEWQEQCSNGVDTQGTFTLTITDVGTPVSNGTGYNAMHGTYSGTFDQIPIDSIGTFTEAGVPTATLNITF